VGYLVLLIGLAYAQQDEKDRNKETRVRITELRKLLSSNNESERLRALEQLGTIHDDEARSILASRLSGDTETVRITAARSISQHRSAGSASALANAIEPNVKSEAVLRAFVDALARLDMCACIPALVAIANVDNHDLAQATLKAVSAIGCPEAVPGLVELLKEAEKEAREPDRVPDPRYRSPSGGKGNPRMPPRAGTPTRQNPGKDQRLAKLADPIRQTLGQITGQSLRTAEEWESWWRSAGGSLKLTSVYLCEDTGQTFEVEPGKSTKCPHSEKKGHRDTFLKHRRS